MAISPLVHSQATPEPSGCREIVGRLPSDVSSFGHGILGAPRSAIRKNNLKWELPVAAATAALIASGADTHVDNHIRSASFVRDSARASNLGIGLEIGGAGLMYIGGCWGTRSPSVANTGWTALEAMGAANLVTLGVKALANRQYPYTKNNNGEFWEGGKSFPSGHAATSFAFASVIAHRYPRNLWLRVGVFESWRAQTFPLGRSGRCNNWVYYRNVPHRPCCRLSLIPETTHRTACREIASRLVIL
ncbi:MAG: phosphatase PAP2 family protein [Acidobacteriota bacterium]|nr:phosphatase PAP2 family protein [Acidobacteriota bacterium]